MSLSVEKKNDKTLMFRWGRVNKTLVLHIVQFLRSCVSGSEKHLQDHRVWRSSVAHGFQRLVSVKWSLCAVVLNDE